MKKKEIGAFTVIFFLTLLYYLIWIIVAVFAMFTGVDSGWVAPALSSGKKDYGVDAFFSMISIGCVVTFMRFWFIPLYQIIYLIVKFFRWLFKKCRQEDKTEIPHEE